MTQGTNKQTLVVRRGTAAVPYYELARSAVALSGERYDAGTMCSAPQVMTYPDGSSDVSVSIRGQSTRFAL